MRVCLLLLALSGCASAPPAAPLLVSASTPTRVSPARTPAAVPAAAASAPRAPREPLWTTALQTHDVVSSGDALLLWSNLTCELRTVDAKTGATRSTVAGPRDLYGDCNCVLERAALGCFRNRGFNVHRPSDAKSLFFRASKDASATWSFEGGVGILVDGTKLTGLDSQTGADSWTATLPASGRLVAAHAGSTVVKYARPGGSGVSAFASRTGKVLWQKDLTTIPSQIVPLDDRTFAVGGETVQVFDRDAGTAVGPAFPNPAAAAVSPSSSLAVIPSGPDLVFDVAAGRGTEYGTTIVVTSREGRERWRHAVHGYARTVAAAGGRVLVQANNQELLALDAATGAVAWRWFGRAHQFHVPTPGLLVITEDDTTYALDLTADLPQREITVQGRVDVKMTPPRPVRVKAGDVTVTPDAQGNFSLRLQGRGTLHVIAEGNALPRDPKATKKGLGTCTVGSAVELDFAKPPSLLALSVHDEPCDPMSTR